jgi:hypothetical protein
MKLAKEYRLTPDTGSTIRFEPCQDNNGFWIRQDRETIWVPIKETSDFVECLRHFVREELK